MKNTDESFYEIQLNTTHLVVVFLGAVAVGVAVFYLGVVIGRGQGAPQFSGEFQAALPAEEASTPPDEELEFYDTVQESQPQGREPQAQSDTAAGRVADQGTPTAADQGEPAGDEDTAPAPSSSGRASPESPQRTPSAGDLPGHDPSIVSGWVIQVRSTTDRGAADSLQATLASAGYPAFVVTADIGGETYYRVRVGRYGRENDARRVAASLDQRQDIVDPWVTEG